MSLKRLVLFTTALLLGLGWTVSAQAQTAQYSLTGGGGQLQIGGGLPLPIQLTNPTATMTVFPQLLIPVAPGQHIITGTTLMAAQQKLVIPTGVLSKPPAQLTLGQFGQNPTLYAVATNLNWVWPTAPAVLSTLARTGAKTTTFVTALGNNIRYSNVLAQKFGGPARIAINPGPPAGYMPAVAVTIFGIAVPGPGNPPCTHTALVPPFPGPGNPACVAGLAQALPTGFAAPGWVVNNFVATPGGTPAAVAAGGPIPGVGIGKFGANGTISFFTFTPAGTMAGFTNMAGSFGYPWTTGMLTISAPLAAGAPEIFTITGMDNRTAGGAGTIQLVSGSLSQRTLSGPNADRGWLRLDLVPFVATPAMPPAMLVGGAGLMALAFGYAVRRFRA